MPSTAVAHAGRAREPRAAEQVGGHARRTPSLENADQAPRAHRHRRARLEDPQHVQEARGPPEVHHQQRRARDRRRRARPCARSPPTRGRRPRRRRARRTTSPRRCRRTRSRAAPPTSTPAAWIIGPWTSTGTSSPPRARARRRGHRASSSTLAGVARVLAVEVRPARVAPARACASATFAPSTARRQRPRPAARADARASCRGRSTWPRLRAAVASSGGAPLRWLTAPSRCATHERRAPRRGQRPPRPARPRSRPARSPGSASPPGRAGRSARAAR